MVSFSFCSSVAVLMCAFVSINGVSLNDLLERASQLSDKLHSLSTSLTNDLVSTKHLGKRVFMWCYMHTHRVICNMWLQFYPNRHLFHWFDVGCLILTLLSSTGFSLSSCWKGNDAPSVDVPHILPSDSQWQRPSPECPGKCTLYCIHLHLYQR